MHFKLLHEVINVLILFSSFPMISIWSDVVDCPLKHSLNGKPQKGQRGQQGSDAHGAINRWAWVDDSRDSKHNEQIKRLCRLKCHSSSQQQQTEVSGNSCFCCDSQQPLLSAVPRLRLLHAEFADALFPPFIISPPLPPPIAVGFAFLSLHENPAGFHHVLHN